MLEGLRTINPKLFYGKFAKKRRITPKVSGNEFLEHFKKIAKELRTDYGSLNKTGTITAIDHASGNSPEIKIPLNSLFNNGNNKSLYSIKYSFNRPSIP
jgi:hypothetical protein